MLRIPAHPRVLNAAALIVLTGLLGGCAWLPGFNDYGHAITPDFFFSAGMKSEDTGSYEAAALFYDRAAEANRRNGDSASSRQARLESARSLRRAGRFEEAAMIYRRLLRADPTDPDARYGLGKTLIALNRAEAALEEFERLLANGDPGRVRGYLGKGVALDLLGRHREAQALYHDGLARAPEDVRLRNNLGLSLALSGHEAMALRHLEPLARKPETSGRVRQNLALVYSLLGRFEDARTVAAYDLGRDEAERLVAYYAAVRERLEDADVGAREYLF